MTKSEQLQWNKPKKKRRSKLKDKSLAKKSAWDAFSLYMRTYYSIKTTNSLNKCICYTCDKIFDIKDIQAGHFIDGRTNLLLFAEEIIKPQCYSCNVAKHGNKVIFTIKLQKELGAEAVKDLIFKYEYKQMTEVVKYKLKDYLRIEQEYKIKLSELLNNFNNKSNDIQI